MTQYWWVLAGIAISVAYTAWPMTAKLSGMPPAWITPVVLVATFVGAMLPGIKGMAAAPFASNPQGLLIFLLAGFANGVAAYYYGLISADREIPTSIFVATVMVGTILCAQIMGIVINREVLTPQQWLGIILACIAIVLIVGPKFF